LRELQELGERKKMLENEKYLNSPSTYEYSIMHCTVSYWTLVEHGDREWVHNRGEGVNFVKSRYIQMWSTKAKPLWTVNIYLIKEKWWAGRKNKYFLGVDTSGRGSAQGKGDEGRYGGCVLYPYMKIEE
jgi:hypothetical protein